MKTKKAYIFAYRFFDFSHQRVYVGGIQTYILDLSLLLTKIGYETNVVVLTGEKKEKYGKCEYSGFSVCEEYCDRGMQHSFNKYYYRVPSTTLFIVITIDMPIISKGLNNVITIQHGVSWDFPKWALNRAFHKTKYAYILRKGLRNLREVRKFLSVSNLVCVDYNYVNWLHTLVDVVDSRSISIIPNYASEGISEQELELKLLESSKKECRNIVFARRMEKVRGVVAFTNIAKRLLSDFPGLHITFAGDGEMLPWVREQLSDYKRIAFTTFHCTDSIAFHKQYDIAVIPSLYSEGTSLSLCESMAAGCYPVSTFVGGLSNIILDGYNGSLCFPDEDSIYSTIVKVLEMPTDTFNTVVRNAHCTYLNSFSKTVWEKRWEDYLTKIIKSNE